MQKIDCVRFYVSDLDAGLVFYRDELGHELIWRTEEQMGLRMPNTDTEIVLHTERQEPEIDFKVQSADEAAVRFEEAGGKIVVPPFDIQIGRCTVVEDPWGNRFRIMLYHNPGKTWGISISSNGPDGIEQTADDLGRSSNYPYPRIDIADPNLNRPDFSAGFDRYRLVESNVPPMRQ